MRNEGGPGENTYFTEMCSGSEAGSYLRLIDLCITQLDLVGVDGARAQDRARAPPEGRGRVRADRGGEVLRLEAHPVVLPV